MAAPSHSSGFFLLVVLGRDGRCRTGKSCFSYTSQSAARTMRRAGQTTESRSPPLPLHASLALPSCRALFPLGRFLSSSGRRDRRRKVLVRNSLYIGNLGPTDGQVLGHLLSGFGVVRYAAVVAAGITPGTTGAPGTPDSCFGVVELQTEAESDAAIKALNGSEFCGRVLEVRWATPSERTACGHPAMFGTMNLSNGG